MALMADQQPWPSWSRSSLPDSGRKPRDAAMWCAGLWRFKRLLGQQCQGMSQEARREVDVGMTRGGGWSESLGRCEHLIRGRETASTTVRFRLRSPKSRRSSLMR